MPIKKSRDKKRRVKVQPKVRHQVMADLQDALEELRAENYKLEEELAEIRRHDKPQINLDYDQIGKVRIPLDLNQEQFSTGAIRRKTLECSLELVPLEAIEGMGDRLYHGAFVRGYGPRNWEKGIPYANLYQHTQIHSSMFAAQAIANPHFLSSSPVSTRDQTTNTINGDVVDSLYGNACASLWGWMATVTFLRRGNPAERKP